MRRLLQRLLSGTRFEDELREEIDSHILMRSELDRSRGLSDDEAGREARRQFGNRRRIEEDTRAVYRSRWLECAVQDLRYSIRSLLRKPGSALAVTLTLGLGIGATTAMYAAVRSVLLEPLPFRDSERLVWVRSVDAARSPNSAALPQRASYPDFSDWRAGSRTLDMVGWGGYEVTLTGQGDPERLTGALLLGNLFRLLGVPPALGSTDGLDHVQPTEPVVVLSDGLWRRRFDSDPDVVGRSVTLNGGAYTVAGVMPAGFRFPIRSWPAVDVWVPVARFNPALEDQRGARLIEVIARLQPGVGLEQAQAEMDVIAARLGDRYPGTNHGVGVRLVPAIEEATGELAAGLWTLLASAGGLLLIASVNVASLLMVRASAREREFAVRSALGAGRGRIGLQLLVESGLMSVAGGLLGCVLASWGVSAFVAWLPPDMPRSDEIALDVPTLGLALLAALATGLVVSLAPAWHACRERTTSALVGGPVASSGNPAGTRLRAVMVVSQIAVAAVLLTGAGLLGNSLWRLDRPAPGFDPANVLTFSIDWPSGKYPRPDEAFRGLRLRLLGIPGIRAVSTGLQLPDRGIPMIDDVSPFVAGTEGRPIPEAERQRVRLLSTQPGYFAALGIPLVRGRDFVDEDTRGSARVAIVNESWARTYFPGENPLGKHFALSSWTLPGEDAAEIVGVAADVTHRGLGAEAQALVYLPFGQQPGWESPIVVKTDGDPLGYAAAVRDAVASLDPDQAVYDLQTLEQRVSGSLADDRLHSLFLGAFSAVALLLAGIGLYSVLSYVVAERTREVGIRLALGADLRDVRMLVLGQGVGLAAAGIALGLAAAASLTRFMSSLLFGISPTDPLTFLAVTTLLLLVAVAACWLPMRAAVKTDPVRALRFE